MRQSFQGRPAAASMWQYFVSTWLPRKPNRGHLPRSIGEPGDIDSHPLVAFIWRLVYLAAAPLEYPGRALKTDSSTYGAAIFLGHLDPSGLRSPNRRLSRVS